MQVMKQSEGDKNRFQPMGETYRTDLQLDVGGPVGEFRDVREKQLQETRPTNHE